MIFASREDAGQRLGRQLKEQGLKADQVLGLPRGGVVVAAEVARAMQLPLDVLIVRKIGHPWFREFAVGAMAEGGVVVLDEAAIGRNPVARAELEAVIQEEKERLQRYQEAFHRAGPSSLADKAVLLVDDGLATGATTEAAVLSAKRQKARHIIIAAPVASTHAVERLRRVADDIIVLCADPDFDAVGHYYECFSQITDEEVLELLTAA